MSDHKLSSEAYKPSEKILWAIRSEDLRPRSDEKKYYHKVASKVYERSQPIGVTHPFQSVSQQIHLRLEGECKILITKNISFEYSEIVSERSKQIKIFLMSAHMFQKIFNQQ